MDKVKEYYAYVSLKSLHKSDEKCAYCNGWNITGDLIVVGVLWTCYPGLLGFYSVMGRYEDLPGVWLQLLMLPDCKMVAVPLMFASNNPAWRILPLVNLRLAHLVFLLRLSSILLVHDSVLAALSLWQHDGLQWIRIHIAVPAWKRFGRVMP
ncbi:hypothetical protein OUZ56_018909 [Daphnia magna]|uniref:Uncharacterized protein n=1 Tax=Daphnia magna TaxID=35525 RepID=A0ABQ9ZA32_9CRUS|nr:hypothetical protein OUZ56_018909 [Daphnia magna]